MAEHMIEMLALNRHAELIHGGEVRLGALARPVELLEEDLLGWPLGRPPVLDPSLESAELAIGEAPYISALEILEEGLGLQAWVEFELASDLIPYVGEDVVVCTPDARRFEFARELLGLEILPGGLLIEAGFGSCHGKGVLPLHKLE